MSASASSLVLRLSARTTRTITVLLAALMLCGCAKKQWHYSPPPAPTPAQDFDAQFDATHLDPNGAARNVDWHPQLAGHLPNPDACNTGQPYTPQCTQNKPFQDQPDGLKEAFCFIGKAVSGSPIQPFYGHADWMVAQFNGTVGWFNFGDDADYDLFLIPATDQLPPAPPAPINAHGLTTNNNHVTNSTSPQYIEMEFDSNETDSVFTKGFWNDFRANGESVDAATLMPPVLHPDTGTLACGSAVGLFGLDCDHGCRSELHPIYGLAIQRTEDRNDNEWSILARNWGTGGYCSQYNDELAETSFSIVLPYTSSLPPTKVEVKDFVSDPSSGGTVGCPTVYFQNGQTLVNVTMSPPEQRPVASFVLKIQWPEGAQAAACTQPKVSTPEMMAMAPPPPPDHTGKLGGEQYMGALLHAAAQSQNPSLKRFNFERDILPSPPSPKTQSPQNLVPPPPPQNCDGVITVQTGVPPTVPPRAVRPLKKDLRKQLHDTNVRNYVCHSYKQKQFSLPAGTTQQDFDRACKGVK